MTSATAQKLLGSGKVKLKNCKSERTGNTFDATVFMEVSEDGKTKFSIAESREETAVEVAKVLKSQLDKIDSPKRESVMEKLAQAAEKAVPASPSPKRKEPER